MMIVMSLVFSYFFRYEIENYTVYLLSGQLIFNFFSEATNQAMTSIVNNRSLLTKVHLPKYIFPLTFFCKFAFFIGCNCNYADYNPDSNYTYDIAVSGFAVLSFFVCFGLWIDFIGVCSIFSRYLSYLFSCADCIDVFYSYFLSRFYPAGLCDEFNADESFISYFKDVSKVYFRGRAADCLGTYGLFFGQCGVSFGRTIDI